MKWFSITLITIAVGLTLFIGGYYAGNTEKQAVDYNKQLLDLVNEERQKAGLKALEYDITLESTAYHKTKDMVVYKYFAHERDGVTVLRDIRKIKPECQTTGENLGITNESMQAIVTGWLNSETHRDIMLNPEHDLTAVSVMKDYDQVHGTVYKATQHFCDL